MTLFERLAAVLLVLLSAAAPAGAQGEQITFDDLRQLMELGTDEAELLRLVQNAEAVRLSDEDLGKLRTLGASQKLVDAVTKKRESNVLERAIALKEQGRTEEEILDWVLGSGARLSLSAADKLRLTRAGVPPAVIRAIEGTFTFPGFRAYRDPLGILAIQHPDDWTTYHWFTGEGLKVLLSPDRNVPKANQFKTGLQIQLSFIGKDSASRREGFDPVAQFRTGLPSLIKLNRSYELEPQGDCRRASLGGHPAVEQEFLVTMVGTPCREMMIESHVKDVKFFVEAVAERDAFPALEKIFRRMLVTLRPFPDMREVVKRPTPFRGDEVLETHREAVVLVDSTFESHGGTGSGFFVRDDGYVLTNHHVICGRRDHAPCVKQANWQLAKAVKVVWDAKVDPGREGQTHRSVDATIVDTFYSLSPAVDIALLRVPSARTPYRTLPTATVGSGLVREGDPVIALGFPKPTALGYGNLYLTSGMLSRINYIEKRFARDGRRRELNDLMTDAVINGGNSGGPCVDLTTGAVIGLNTFTLATPEKELEYAGVVVMDHVLQHFPQIRWYPKGGRMGPAEHLELGAMLLASGNDRSADVEFTVAHRERNDLDPEQRARLFHQISVLLARADDADSEKLLDQSLAEDPRHGPALTDKAWAHAGRGEYDKAVAMADRLIDVAKDDWSSYYTRAEICRRAGDLDGARRYLKEAMGRGGAESDSGVLRVEGLIHAAEGRKDEAIASYRRALQVDENDPWAAVLLAEAMTEKSTEQGLVEWGRITQSFAETPYVHERYGRYLMSRNDRFDEGVKTLVRSALMSIDREGRAPLMVLYDLADRTIERDDHEATGLDAATALASQWPRSTGSHTLLARYWTRKGRPAIATAHANAAERMMGRGIKSWPDLLSSEDVLMMAGAGYDVRLVSAVLDEGNLGALPSEAEMKAVQSRGFQLPLAMRLINDQMTGGRALSNKAMVEFAAQIDVSDAKAAKTSIKIRNDSPFPLTDIRIQEIYKDKDKNVIGRVEGTFNPTSPVFQPGDDRTFTYFFNDWDALKQKGIDRAQVAYWSVQTVYARNALYLNRMTVEGGYKDGTMQFQVANGSAFTVKSVTVRCRFLDAEKKPLTDPKGFYVDESRTWTVTLAPDQKTEIITVKDWSNWDYLYSIGVAKGTPTVIPQLIVSDAAIVPE